MRFFTRFTAIVGVSLISILYLAWVLPSFSVKNELKNAWSKSPRRLIVFGDSWSDNGEYPIDPPSKELSPPKDLAQGKVWTEWLCTAISCTHHDNFARSLPYSWIEGYKGAVVDSELLNKTFNHGKEAEEPLADLKTQIQQWIKFEKKQYMSSRIRESERKGTIFTVWFSLWDLWYYSRKTKDEASKAVEQTVDKLFEQLNEVAKNWEGNLKVVMPEAIDPTFLPGWVAMRTGPNGNDQNADDQRTAVSLVQQWNAALDHKASSWDRGQLYIYNTNEWLLDQVREQQLVVNDMADHNGLGQAGSPWDNVVDGCLGSNVKGNTSSSLPETNTGVARCKNPSKYLFWDDMHLGPAAMKMIGEMIAKDIAETRGNVWFAHEKSNDSGSASSKVSAEAKPTPASQ